VVDQLPFPNQQRWPSSVPACCLWLLLDVDAVGRAEALMYVRLRWRAETFT
jgi:hypothetical protein